ncbi:choline-binding surface protein A [Streptococcus pneumoniae]|uniref:pneumococcal surface protein PspC, LPXTG-anchored form n=2 Tax=Streptococcus pneumoniae TaxID=1313 RepID=UPI0005E31DD9|nr:choline-binding surface protein A [Streptococcus pneumoniae]CIT07033.1 choline-binding surface protein A [Streptococcus pneumoniae]COP82813.1 choline-binding surface protein A [Streptococcus pneumoniae]
MFASKSERKVHYSIRKFSIGVASVVVASLVMGSVVHATEKEGATQVPTSSNRANESQAEQGEQPKKLDSERDKARKEVEEYVKKIVGESYAKSTKKRHTITVALVNELNNIKNEYLNKIVESTSESQLQILMMESRSKVDEAVSKFEKDSSSSSSSDSSTKPEASDTAKPNKPTEPGEKVAEAKKKVEEAEKKAKDQKEEDRRNYPTITYKTIELEIAEAEVGVAKAELELAQAQVQIPQDTEKINAAKAKVEAAKSNVKKLEKIKSDIEKTYLYKLDNSTKETPKSRVRRNSPQVGDSRELKETIDKAKETLSTYMVTRLTKLDPSVFWFADLLMDAKKVVEEYKTKLEDASDKKSVEDLRKEAEGKIESLIVTHQNREKENQPAPQPGGQAGGSMVVPPVTQTPPSTSQSPGQKATEAEKKKLQDLIRQFQEALNKLDDETKTVPDGAKLTGEAGKAYNETRTYAKEVVDKSKKLLSQTAVTMDELAMQLTKLNDAMSKLKEAKAKLVPEVKPQPENPEPKPQPEGEKPSVPDINQEKEKAKLAIATYMSKILDDIKKHHLKKEKHHQIVALIKDLDKLKKQALSEIDNVNTKVEIENTVHKVFADMDTVVTKFKKGLTQDTPKEPDNKKPSAPKPDMQPSPQPEGKKPSVPAQPGTEDKKPSAPKPDMQPSPQPEGKKPSVPEINQEKEKAKLAVATEKKLPSTGVASNLVLEIIGLLGLIGTSFIAMKRRK